MQPKPTPRTPAFLGRCALAFLLSWAALFLLLLGACALPGEPVRRNLARSVPGLQQEGMYPEYFGFKLFQMDNYTDTIMLFEAASADETDPLTAAMTNTAYNIDNFSTLADDLGTYLEARAAGTPLPADLEPFSYARYWHGYLIWLRPLLCLMPYQGVRVVQYLVLAALLAGVLWGLRRRAGLRPMLWFAASQLLVAVFFVPRQVQYFTCFLIAYAGCAWVLARPRTVWQLGTALVVLGAATAAGGPPPEPPAGSCPSATCWSPPSSRWGCRWRSGWSACPSGWRPGGGSAPRWPPGRCAGAPATGCAGA